MIKVPERFYERISSLNNFIMRSSTKNIILIIVIVWLLLYIPTSLYFSLGQKDHLFDYYPSEAGPEGITSKDYGVVTEPIHLDNASQDRFILDVVKGDTIVFNWTAQDYDSSKHLGRVNVYYEINGENDKIRLRKTVKEEGVVTWYAEKEFCRNGTISYYYRVDKNDIAKFHQRASVILEGGNLYEDIQTGPPPLINFLMIPPTLLTPPVSMGGAYLSFHIYFSLFTLFDALILFFAFKDRDKTGAFFAGVLFLVNPVTLSNIHQDEAVVAFMILLPVFFMLKNREKVSSLFTGLSVPVKIWGIFLYPLYLIREDRDLKKGFMNIFTALAVTVSIFLFFYLLWGEKSVWFLSQYSGQTNTLNMGPVSFWGRWFTAFPALSEMISRKMILALVGISELIIFFIAYKKGWSKVASLTAFLSIFFALYLKIHWDYFIILFPFMAWFAVRDKRFFGLYVALTIVLEISMIFASPWISIGGIGMALLTTLVTMILLIYVYMLYRCPSLSNISDDDL